MKSVNLKWSKGLGLMLCVLLFILLYLLTLTLVNVFSDKRMIYLDIQDYPKDWSAKYGIGKSHIRESIIENFDSLESNAFFKLGEILNEQYRESDNSANKEELADDESSFPVEISVFNTDLAKFYYLTDKLTRKLLKKEDVWVNLHINEFEDNLKARVVTTDWNNNTKSKQIVIEKSDYKNNIEKTINSLFMDISALICGIHHPITSVLYDYHIVDMYQGVSPWNNNLYTAEEKDSILLKYALDKRFNYSIGYILLGSINEKIGDESNDALLEKLNKSKFYYQAYLEHDTIFKDKIVNKISLIENRINNITNSTEKKESNHFNGVNDIIELEKNGLIKLDSITEQLIIVTDPSSFEKQNDNGKRRTVHKARMSVYERNTNNEWVPALFEEPVVVNLSYNGLIPEKKKKEGDGCVPSGYFPIPLAFGFKDIETKMKYKIIGEKDYWVSNPQSRYYNTLQKESDKEYHDGMSERLANIDLYEYAVVIGHNMNPIKKGAGSAIFIHIARSKDAVTAGCIAITKENLISLIKWLDSNKHPHIYIGKMPD